MSTLAAMHKMLGFTHEPIQTAFHFMDVEGKHIPGLANYLIERLQEAGVDVHENGGTPYLYTADRNGVHSIYISHGPRTAAKALEVSHVLDEEYGRDVHSVTIAADPASRFFPKKAYGPVFR